MHRDRNRRIHPGSSITGYGSAGIFGHVAGHRPAAVGAVAFVTLFTLGAGGVLAEPGGQGQGAQKRIAEGRVLVQPRAGLPDAQFRKLLGEEGAKPQHKLERLNVHVVEVPKGAEEAIARKLARHPHVEFAEVDEVLPLEVIVPNDPKYSSAWHLPKIQAPTAWDVATGSGVTVAVLDTGVDSAHLDLAANMLPGWNVASNSADTSDIHGHGTWVSGTVAALSNNALGVTSIAWSAKVLPVRITNSTDGSASSSTIATGLTWAADHGADVANISYGVTGSSTVASAAQYMRGKGGVVVVAAGNQSTLLTTVNSPYMITASATDANDVKASWSNYGDLIDFAAPGVGIWTTSRGGTYSAVSGTSFASPATAAVTALVMAANPGLLPADVEAVLQNSADDLGTAGWDTYYGYGRVNAARAVSLATQTVARDTQAPTVAIGAPAAGSTVEGIVNVDVTASDNYGVMKVDLYAGSTFVGSDTTAPYAFSWDASGLAAGSSVTLTAKASDAANNVGTSAGVAVKIAGPADTTPPTVTLTNPPEGATVSGTVTLSASGSDNAQLSSVSIYADGKLMCTASTTASCGWNTRKVKTGSHTVTATAKDAAGNQSTKSVTVYK